MAGFVVALDPGHGGRTQKGCYIPQYGDEADYNLMMAQKLAARLRDEYAIRSVLLRINNSHIPKHERNRLAKANGVDLVVSIHVNTNASHKISGLSCFVWENNKRSLSAASEIIAKRPPELVGNCKPLFVLDDRLWRTAPEHHWLANPVGVVGAYRADCVLVECGFAWTDTDYLLSLHGQDAIAACMADGIEKYRKEYHNV